MYRECNKENHVTRNCDNYWRWREQEFKRKLRELKEKLSEEEKVLRCTMQPLREVWMMIGIEKVDTHKRIMVKVLLDSGATRMFMDKKFAKKYGFKLEKLERPSRVTNVNKSHNSGGLIIHEYYAPSSISVFSSCL